MAGVRDRYRREVRVACIILLCALFATAGASAQTQAPPEPDVDVGHLVRLEPEAVEYVLLPGGGTGSPGGLPVTGGGTSSPHGSGAGGATTTTGSPPPATTTDADDGGQYVAPRRGAEATQFHSPVVDALRHRMDRISPHLLEDRRPAAPSGLQIAPAAPWSQRPLATEAAEDVHGDAEVAPMEGAAPAAGFAPPALEREEAVQPEPVEEEHGIAVRSIEMDAPPAPGGRAPIGPAGSPAGGGATAVLPSGDGTPEYLPGAVTAVAAAVLWHLISFFAPLLTARRQDPLSHKARRRLSDAVRRRPGAHLRQLADMAGLAMGQTTHHLKVLVASGAVVRVRLGGFVCFFPDDESAAALSDAAAVLRSARARRFLCHVDAHPGCTAADAEATLGVPRGGLKYHATRLVATGLLEPTPRGRERALDVTPVGRAAAAPLQGQARGAARAAGMYGNEAACAT